MIVFCLLLSLIDAMAQSNVLPLHSFASSALGRSRNIQIALPASYDASNALRYPVVYLHDGQNVFSTAGNGVAFGWGNWRADVTARELTQSQKASEVILVAIHNSEERYQEYKGPNLLSVTNPTPYQRYARFLVEELKPWVDQHFRTRIGPSDTAIIGSSMGGLASLALAWEHPDVFGGVGCLSGAFQVEKTNFLRNILAPYAKGAKGFRIYLDSGVVDFSGGDDGQRNTERVVFELRRIGWKDGVDLRHFVDAHPLSSDQVRATDLPASKWDEAQRNQHNEFYWRLRFGAALEFLFPNGSITHR